MTLFRIANVLFNINSNNTLPIYVTEYGCLKSINCDYNLCMS